MRFISIIKERHISWGITLSAIITSALYVILSLISLIGGVEIFSGAFLVSDYQFLLGSIIGVIYSLRQCQPEQPLMKYGIIVGVLGGIFASLIIFIYVTFLSALVGASSFIDLLAYLAILLISGVVIGLLAGALIGTYYMYKEMKEDTKVEKDDHLDDDFFNDLIEK